MTDSPLSADRWRVLNLQRCAEAMQQLYYTYITKEGVAQARGDAIQAIQRMIDGLGGENMISKIEAVPWTARLQASGEPELVQLAKEIKKAI